MSTGDAGQAGAAQGGENGSAEAQQGPDIGQLASALADMQGGQEELRASMQQLLQAGQPQEEHDPGPQMPDLSFLDPESVDFDPTSLSERINEVISQTAEQHARALVDPIAKQVQDERVHRETQALFTEFPDMVEVYPQVRDAARQVADQRGWGELGNDPAFHRIIFMAGRAAQEAQAEGGESPAAAHLEGGGARPAAQQVDVAQQIVGGGSSGELGRRALPFGGR